jgi:hypothetical protein
MIIKILFTEQIEKVIYSKNLGEEYGDNCTICVNNFINNMEIYRTPCEHIFHKDCLNKYLKKIHKKNKLTCPNCNQNLLLDKKFLKLRNDNENLKIKINKKKENLINNIDNIENIGNIETDKKNILDIYNIATNNKNDKNDDKTNSNINKERNEILIIKKRKKKTLNQNEKHAATTENKNIFFNIYNPNENFFKKNKKEENEEDVLYIYDSEKNSEEDKKDNIKSLNEDSIDNDNKERIDIGILNINKNKKIKSLKSLKSQIKFAEMENDNLYRNASSKDINSNRGFIGSKTTFNQIIDVNKK